LRIGSDQEEGDGDNGPDPGWTATLGERERDQWVGEHGSHTPEAWGTRSNETALSKAPAPNAANAPITFAEKRKG
jgi:hypothetical protein